MAKIKKDENSILIEGPYSSKDISSLKMHGKLDKLSLTKLRNLTVMIAKELSGLQSVRHLFIWSSVNKTAMRHVITMPGLEVLDIFEIRAPGKLKYFSEAINLTEFRCNHCLNESDLIELSNLPKVKEIGAQNSEVTKVALEGLLAIPSLENLDLEAANLTDKLAAILGASRSIKHLSVGASKITKNGLKSICKMEQLESLDIWSIDIDEDDLKSLLNLGSLRYLSLGGYEGQTRLKYKGILPYIEELPKLKKLWLDGVLLTDKEKLYLNEKYEYFRN